MTVNKLKEVYDLEPFRPFTLRLADGRAIPVLHREFMMAAPSGQVVVVMQPDDTMNIIDLNLVTDIELKIRRNARKPVPA
jgi:hypothetical protein